MSYYSDMADITRNLVDLEGYQIVNKQTYNRVLLERRLMFGATGLTVIAILFFIISISTPHWARVDIQHSKNTSTRLHLGIWGRLPFVLILLWKIVRHVQLAKAVSQSIVSTIDNGQSFMLLCKFTSYF